MPHPIQNPSCERCHGEGRVIVFEGKEYRCGFREGMRRLGLIRDCTAQERELVNDPTALLQLLAMIKFRGLNTNGATCSDCRGRGYITMEQLNGR